VAQKVIHEQIIEKSY